MPTSRSLAAFASLFLVAAAVPATAFADETGNKGSVEKVELNTPSSDTYLQYHGRVTLEWGKNGHKKDEYRWGGTSCGSRTLSDNLIQVLIDASRRGNLQVTPRYQTGQGDVKCLVGFSIEEKR